METGIRTLTSGDLNQFTTTKQESFGARGETADGRRFRYCGAPSAVTAGQVLIAPSLTTAHQNLVIPAAVAAGSTSIVVTLGAAAATADQYEGGYLTIGTDGSGVPVTKKVRGNTSGNASAQITVFLDPKEPLPYALTTTNVASLAPSPYSAVAASATAGVPVGVAAISMPSGQSYGWVQSYGPCGVINDAAGSLSAVGKVKQSTTVAGSVVSGAAAADVPVGYMIQTAAASKSALAMITLD